MDAFFTHLFGSTPDQQETSKMADEEITTRRALEVCMGRLHMHAGIRNWFAQQLYDARRKEDDRDQPVPDRVHIMCALDELSDVDKKFKKAELLRRIDETRIHLVRSLQGAAVNDLETVGENETTPEPEATKPSINWDHVSPRFRFLARDQNGAVYLYSKRPCKEDIKWMGSPRIAHAGTFTSCDPGTCPWDESLVERPTVTEAPRRGFATPLHRRDMEI